jgi:putative oxidoreductase
MNPRKLINFTAEAFRLLSKMTWIPALLTRLFVGYFFFSSGWAKIHDLATFTANFQGWGIPYPAFNAALSAYTECIGGALTIAGLGMRFVSIPMIINMAVAVLSVKLKEVSSLSDFANLDEPLYALTYVWLLFAGAGWVSFDGIVKLVISGMLSGRMEATAPTSPVEATHPTTHVSVA